MVGTGRFAEFIPWTAPPAVSFPSPSSTTAAPVSMGPRLRTHFGRKKRIRPNKKFTTTNLLSRKNRVSSPTRLLPTMRMAAIYVGLAVLALLTTICVPVSGSNTGGYESSTRARARACVVARLGVFVGAHHRACVGTQGCAPEIPPSPPPPSPAVAAPCCGAAQHPAAEWVRARCVTSECSECPLRFG